MKHYRFEFGCRETIKQLFHQFEGETRRFSNLAILVTSIALFLDHSSQNSFSIVHALTSKDLKKSFFAGAPFFVHVNIACFPPVCYTNVKYRHQNIELLTTLLLPSHIIASIPGDQIGERTLLPLHDDHHPNILSSHNQHDQVQLRSPLGQGLQVLRRVTHVV